MTKEEQQLVKYIIEKTYKEMHNEMLKPFRILNGLQFFNEVEIKDDENDDINKKF